MGTNNMHDEEARKIMKEMAESIEIAMMGTNCQISPLHIVPMSTKKVDDMGAFWFLSNKQSKHNSHIRNEERAQLIYVNPKSEQFMTLYGDALIRTDMHILKDLYEKNDDIWFKGIDDPNLTAIQIKPTEGYYWDSTTNSMVALFQTGGMATKPGEQTDMGLEGEIKI
ncbi:pyridoxamine 5'-phosphate oxidase family protein [Arenibacter sp. M-2]|uniref:pyridoxamine 5'-phosphate oxidase family protein n=1 Tax=Arenibacter sp. M-2 TaxID=3053612 RepID=UPI002571199D|nr:pyridoxamine 5'-phosphate oxidase family protein [Arenibacter sp. M-2]MDL5514376.1 pyridoxamine 5'-phosphate oxidase family protein [Arenibacter sp. M-2]